MLRLFASRQSAPRRSLARAAVPWLFVLVVGEVALVGWIYHAEKTKLAAQQFGWFYREGPISDRFEVDYEGLREPPTRPASETRLSDSEEVIGIEAGGKARAYRISAMRDQWRHIINDVVSGVPVTITYCDLNECIRAFTGPEGRGPLDVSQGGLKADRMVLKSGGIGYLQESGARLDTEPSGGPFPYPTMPATRTTWKSWREAHPETDVFVGVPAGSP